MGFRELPFQILDPIPEHLRFRVGSIRIARTARTAAGARGDQAQVTAGFGTARAAPRIHLTMHFVHRFGLIQSGNFIRARDPQYCAAV
jgi:hypothetical protein